MEPMRDKNDSKSLSLGVLCDLLLRRIASACCLKWPIRCGNAIRSRPLTICLLAAILAVVYIGQIPLFYGRGPDYLGAKQGIVLKSSKIRQESSSRPAAGPGHAAALQSIQQTVDLSDRIDQKNSDDEDKPPVLQHDKISWKTVLALYKASGLVGGSRRLLNLLGSPLRWFGRSPALRRRAYIEQPCDPTQEPKPATAAYHADQHGGPHHGTRSSNIGFKPHYTGHCADIDALCLEEVAELGFWSCACPLSHYWSGWRKRCREMKGYHDGCVSNDECQAYDHNSFCDYAPVYRHESPYCSCKTGFLYDSSIMKCVSCGSVRAGPDSETGCPPPDDESHLKDPLRVWLPVKIIGSALLLVIAVIMGLFYLQKFCSKMAANRRSARKQRKKAKNGSGSGSGTDQANNSPTQETPPNQFQAIDWNQYLSQQSAYPEHLHGGFHTGVTFHHQQHGFEPPASVPPLLNGYTHLTTAAGPVSSVVPDNSFSSSSMVPNIQVIQNSGQIAANLHSLQNIQSPNLQHTNQSTSRQSSLSNRTTTSARSLMTHTSIIQPPTYAEAIKTFIDPEPGLGPLVVGAELDDEDPCGLSDASLTDTGSESSSDSASDDAEE